VRGVEIPRSDTRNRNALKKERDMSHIESVQAPIEIRELTSVELDGVAGGLSWFDVLEVACFLSPACAVGYGAHMLFAE
jgi:hypothetical protein